MLASTPPVSDTVQEYIVKSGDSLYAISEHLFGSGYDWPWLYDENLNVVGRNPNLIFPGQKLIPRKGKHAAYGTSVWTSSTYKPRHAVVADNDVSEAVPITDTVSSHPYGTLSCSGLESLWRSAGGNPGEAFIAAEIAEAESGGNQYATGPAGERGYWQIHPDHGSLSTYDAYGNARAAVIISNDGTNWSPWTTFTSGAYIGRC